MPTNEREITLTDAEIEALPEYAREVWKLHEAAQPGPWESVQRKYRHSASDPKWEVSDGGKSMYWTAQVLNEADAAFIAESRTAVPRLLRDLAEARRALKLFMDADPRGYPEVDFYLMLDAARAAAAQVAEER